MKKVIIAVGLVAVGFIGGWFASSMSMPALDYQRIAFSLVDAEDACQNGSGQCVTAKLMDDVLKYDSKRKETARRIAAYIERNHGEYHPIAEQNIMSVVTKYYTPTDAK